jgi:hypothetical protein
MYTEREEDSYLVGWVHGIATTSGEGQYIAPEEHLDLTYAPLVSTVVELPPKLHTVARKQI